MRLLGREVTADKVLERIEDRLRERGLLPPDAADGGAVTPGVEPRVDPLSFNVRALEEHADPTVALPKETRRGTAGQLAQAARWAFRTAGQLLIDEALSRQRLFNGHVRDSYAQLSAEVLQLRAEVARLRDAESARARAHCEQAAPPRPDAAPSPKALPVKRKPARPAKAAAPSGSREPRGRTKR